MENLKLTHPLHPNNLKFKKIVNINVADSPSLTDHQIPFSKRWRNFEEYLLENGVPEVAFERQFSQDILQKIERFNLSSLEYLESDYLNSEGGMSTDDIPDDILEDPEKIYKFLQEMEQNQMDEASKEELLRNKDKITMFIAKKYKNILDIETTKVLVRAKNKTELYKTLKTHIIAGKASILATKIAYKKLPTKVLNEISPTLTQLAQIKAVIENRLKSLNLETHLNMLKTIIGWLEQDIPQLTKNNATILMGKLEKFLDSFEFVRTQTRTTDSTGNMAIVNYNIMLKLYRAVPKAIYADQNKDLSPEKYDPITGERATFSTVKEYFQEFRDNLTDNEDPIRDIQKGTIFVSKPIIPEAMSFDEAKRTFYQWLYGHKEFDEDLIRAFKNAELKEFLRRNLSQPSVPKTQPSRRIRPPKKGHKPRQDGKSNTSEKEPNKNFPSSGIPCIGRIGLIQLVTPESLREAGNQANA